MVYKLLVVFTILISVLAEKDSFLAKNDDLPIHIQAILDNI